MPVQVGELLGRGRAEEMTAMEMSEPSCQWWGHGEHVGGLSKDGGGDWSR